MADSSGWIIFFFWTKIDDDSHFDAGLFPGVEGKEGGLGQPPRQGRQRSSRPPVKDTKIKENAHFLPQARRTAARQTQNGKAPPESWGHSLPTLFSRRKIVCVLDPGSQPKPQQEQPQQVTSPHHQTATTAKENHGQPVLTKSLNTYISSATNLANNNTQHTTHNTTGHNSTNLFFLTLGPSPLGLPPARCPRPRCWRLLST